MLKLIDVARDRGLSVMTGQILKANKRMLAMAKTLGFVVDETEEDQTVKHVQLALR
jgi:acetyltransferase